MQGWTSGAASKENGGPGAAAALCAIGMLRQLANSVDQAGGY